MMNVGDIRVFYSQVNRDRKARELEKMGYRIEKYSGLINYFFKVLTVPDER